MSTLSATISGEYTQRYEALLRATNAIGTCNDCEAASAVLVHALHEVIAFDYLQLIVFENDTSTVGWHLLYSNGATQSLPLAQVIVEGTPTEWVHESQQALVIGINEDDFLAFAHALPRAIRISAGIKARLSAAS